MLKNILNLNGAQELSKNAQKGITGGNPFINEMCGDNCNNPAVGCPTNQTCVQVFCGPNGPFGGLEIGWTCTNGGGNK